MVHVDDDTGDGVTADPEVTETTLTPADEYFVMACDGLWDVVSNEEAVAMIKVREEKGGVVATKRDKTIRKNPQRIVIVIGKNVVKFRRDFFLLSKTIDKRFPVTQLSAVFFLAKYIEPPCFQDTVKEPSMCAKRLGSEAMTRMSGDNITVVVAYLKDVSTAEVVTWERAF